MQNGGIWISTEHGTSSSQGCRDDPRESDAIP